MPCQDYNPAEDRTPADLLATYKRTSKANRPAFIRTLTRMEQGALLGALLDDRLRLVVESPEAC